MKDKSFNLFEKNKVEQNKVTKYSELIGQFMAPFAKELENFDSYEESIEFSISAWNFANMKQFLPIGEDEYPAELLQDEGFDLELLDKMIAHKISNFQVHTDFIISFKIEKTGETPVLRVITQESNTYIENMLDAIEEEFDQEDYEENFINRNAIIIKPQQPFIDWLNVFYPDDNYVVDDFIEPSVYLVSEDIDDIKGWLKKKFDTFFMIELENFRNNKKEWPQKRSYKMFTQWFQVQISTSVFDTEEEPVMKY